MAGEDKAFENALAIYDVESADGWKNIAATVPKKSLEEVKYHYQLLVEDIYMIESGVIPLPDYPEEVQHDVNDSSNEEVEESESDMSSEELQSKSLVAVVESCDTTIEQVYDESVACDEVVLALTSEEVEESESDMQSESLVVVEVVDAVPKVESCDTTTIVQVYNEPLACDEVVLALTSEEVEESEADMSSEEVQSDSLVVAAVPKVESCDTTTIEQVYYEPLASDEVGLALTSEEVEESESDMACKMIQFESLFNVDVVDVVPKVECFDTKTIEQVYDEPLASDKVGLAPTSGEVEESESLVTDVLKVESWDIIIEQVYDEPLASNEVVLAPISEEVKESESDISNEEVQSESLVAVVPKVESCDTKKVYDEPFASNEVVLAPTSEEVKESESDMSSEEVESDSLVATVLKVDSCDITTMEQVYDEPLASDGAGLVQVEATAVPKVVSYEKITEQVFDRPLPFDEAGLSLLLSQKLDFLRQQQLDRFTMNP